MIKYPCFESFHLGTSPHMHLDFRSQKYLEECAALSRCVTLCDLFISWGKTKCKHIIADPHLSNFVIKDTFIFSPYSFDLHFRVSCSDTSCHEYTNTSVLNLVVRGTTRSGIQYCDVLFLSALQGSSTTEITLIRIDCFVCSYIDVFQFFTTTS